MADQPEEGTRSHPRWRSSCSPGSARRRSRHFRHSLVGSIEAFYRAALGDASWNGMLGGFVAPSVLGNAVGRVLLVARLNYGQVLADRED